MMPLHWYFTSALPRALLGTLPLAAVGMMLERRVRSKLACVLIYIAAYSLLPHKEVRHPECRSYVAPATSGFLAFTKCSFQPLHAQRSQATVFFGHLHQWGAARLLFLSHACVQVRFLFPVLPLFNVAAAAGLVRLYRNRRKGLFWQGLWLTALAALACSVAAVVLMTAVSRCNYPGGHALAKMHVAENSSAAEALRSGAVCLKQTPWCAVKGMC